MTITVDVGEILTHVTFIAISVGGADFEHLTWVSVLLFAFMTMSRAIGLDIRFFWAYMTLQSIVLAGVAMGSFADCTVFESAFDTYGAAVYIFFNFMIHYFPSNAQYALATRKHISPGINSVGVQCSLGLGTALVWLHFEDPMETYGCALPSTLGVTGLVAMTLVTLVAGISCQKLPSK
jgi:hypothetical protein